MQAGTGPTGREPRGDQEAPAVASRRSLADCTDRSSRPGLLTRQQVTDPETPPASLPSETPVVCGRTGHSDVGPVLSSQMAARSTGLGAGLHRYTCNSRPPVDPAMTCNTRSLFQLELAGHRRVRQYLLSDIITSILEFYTVYKYYITAPRLQAVGHSTLSVCSPLAGGYTGRSVDKIRRATAR